MRIKGSPLRESPAEPHPDEPAADSARRYGVDITGRAVALGARLRGSRVRGRLSARAGRAHLPVGGRPLRHRHLRAARSLHRRHRGPGRLGRSVQSRADRRRGRPARLVVVGRGLRREPRRARDDRDPEGEARVPLSAAHHDAGEERQGGALPAHPSRRDHSRAHQSGGIQPLPAGEGKRGAARPHGDHQGSLRAVLSRTRRASTRSWSTARPPSATPTSIRTCCTSPLCSPS